MIYELQITTTAGKNMLWEDFSQRFCWLRERGYLLGVTRVAYEKNDCLFLTLSLRGNNDDLFLSEEDIIYIFKHQISEFLAEHILRDWEDKMLIKEVGKKNRHIPPQDQEIIVNKAAGFLQSFNENESLNLLLNYGRKNKIAHKIMEYLYSHKKLVIEGLINFCLPDYLTDLRFAVDLACEELRNEKEYNDFVKLLRYFVDTQPSCIQEVNLRMDADGLFWLWDGQGINIEEKLLDCYGLFIDELGLDDLLVSILVTVSPRRIILHNVEQLNTEPVKMIRKVFGERIKDCSGCERCFNNGWESDKRHH